PTAGRAHADAVGAVLAAVGQLGVPARLPAADRRLAPHSARPRGPRPSAERPGAREERLRARLRAQQPPPVGPDSSGRHPSHPRRQAVSRCAHEATPMRTAADAARTPDAVRHGPTLLTDQDLYLFNEGTHLGLADKLGAHPAIVDGVEGTIFAVWAPNASA